MFATEPAYPSPAAKVIQSQFCAPVDTRGFRADFRRPDEGQTCRPRDQI
jgi:hypothetical protein